MVRGIPVIACVYLSRVWEGEEDTRWRHIWRDLEDREKGGWGSRNGGGMENIQGGQFPGKRFSALVPGEDKLQDGKRLPRCL